MFTLRRDAICVNILEHFRTCKPCSSSRLLEVSQKRALTDGSMTGTPERRGLDFTNQTRSVEGLGGACAGTETYFS